MPIPIEARLELELGLGVELGLHPPEQEAAAHEWSALAGEAAALAGVMVAVLVRPAQLVSQRWWVSQLGPSLAMGRELGRGAARRLSPPGPTRP